MRSGDGLMPYFAASAIVLAVWLVLIVGLALLKWAGLIGYDDDWVAYLIAGILVVSVIGIFKRKGLMFCHCLPVVIVVIVGLAFLFAQ